MTFLTDVKTVTYKHFALILASTLIVTACSSPEKEDSKNDIFVKNLNCNEFVEEMDISFMVYEDDYIRDVFYSPVTNGCVAAVSNFNDGEIFILTLFDVFNRKELYHTAGCLSSAENCPAGLTSDVQEDFYEAMNEYR